ncbi:hypothetical protein RB195_004815 [Necator americanus]|uniref:Metalloendopeptidase n=1 Tax=Necator americanus TaxID=51031 RepID=A0ABR1BJT3_NECAM
MIPVLMFGRLIVFLIAVQIVSARVKPIDIFSQPAGADIPQMRNKKSKMFNALHKNSFLKWDEQDPNGNIVIPYEINGHFDASQKRTIAVAMRRIEDNTCIRFKIRENEWNYVAILNQNRGGCFATVGRMRGRSSLMLEHNDERSCLVTKVVLHELMHVVGLWHEHERYDRDNYVKVHYENIKEGYWSQFSKVSPYQATTYGIPYDYKSIMHYGKTFFAKPGTISMETLDPSYQDVIGNQDDASSSDYRKICEIYQCKKCMGQTSDEGTDEIKPTPPTRAPSSTSAPTVGTRIPITCYDEHPKFCNKRVRRVSHCTFAIRMSTLSIFTRYCHLVWPFFASALCAKNISVPSTSAADESELDEELKEDSLSQGDWHIEEDSNVDYEVLLRGFRACAERASKQRTTNLDRISKTTKELLERRRALRLDPNASHIERLAPNNSCREALQEDLLKYRQKRILEAAQRKTNLKKCRRDLCEYNVLAILLIEDGTRTSSRREMEIITERFYSNLFRSPTPVSSQVIPTGDAPPRILPSEVRVDIKSMILSIILSNICFADDIVLFSSSTNEAETMLNELNETGKRIGLRIKRKKTQFMMNADCEDGGVQLGGSQIVETSSYVYLGRSMNMENDLKEELNRRMRAA